MKFAVTHPLLNGHPDPELASPGGLAAVARAAEAAGFAGFGVTDHPAPTAEWLEAGGHHALDPFGALTWVAAHTTHIRLITNLLVLPYRNPFLVASAGATLDNLSGGRLTLTLGTGYLEGEYDALGVDPSTRNARFDEYFHALRAAWSGEDVVLDGEHVAADHIRSWPPPVQPGGPPLWIGGNAPLSQRRAARTADGWAPFPAGRGLAAATRTRSIRNAADLGEVLPGLLADAESHGRNPADLDIAFAVTGAGQPGSEGFDAAAYRSGVDELSALGVTWCWVQVPGDSVAAAVAALELFGSQVIGP